MGKNPDFNNYKNHKIASSLDKILLDCRTIMGNTVDLNIVEINICGADCALVTIEGMVSTSAMAELVFQPLMALVKPPDVKPKVAVYHFLTRKSLLTAERHILYDYGGVVQDLFSGFAVIFIDGVPKGISLGIQGFEKKAITEPKSEHNIMGSQEAFTEVVRTNISLVRRRLKSPSLRFEMHQIGEKSSTDVCLVYMTDKAPHEIVDRIRKKLCSIKLDTIISSGYVRSFLEDGIDKNLFSNVGSTERPDVLCTKLNEGKVCVLIDGTPFSLICPTLFVENFKTIDDYCWNSYFATFLRWIRFLAFFLATAFPGIYVAAASYHPEILNLKLMLNLSASEQATPYPLFVEVLIIMALLELMSEASIRLPTAMGSAISIVGGLIIGDAAVKSGIISGPELIIVGLTATSSFIIPSLNQQTSILRLAYIFAGGAAGFFGIAICTVLILANVCSMNEFDIPFTSPISPFSKKGSADVLGRSSFKTMEKSRTTIDDYTDK
ncbi:MAG: spore germination protein [Ruminococcus sp.]|nr:spore germination protein [Ruminococcus sp.]